MVHSLTSSYMNKRLIVGLLVIMLLISGFGPVAARSVRSVGAQAAFDFTIYDDELASGWEDWSWDTDRNFDNPEPVHNGSASIAVTYTVKWGGLYLHTDTALPASGYTAIRFWVHGGTTGSQSVSFHVNEGEENYTFLVPANTWLSVTVPMSVLGNPTTLSRLFWQDNSGGPQPIFYLDDISLIGTPPFNGWLVLDGTDKYASAPYQPELDLRGRSFTVEMWLRLSDVVLTTSTYDIYPFRQYSSFRFVVHRFQNIDNTQFPPVFYSTYCTHLLMYSNSGSCWWIAPDRGTPLGTNWGHLAGVYDQTAAEARVYWNGHILDRIAETQSPDTPGDLLINWGGNSLVGLADEIRISDTIRYADNFSRPAAPFVCDANTKALWHFDEPEGSTVFHDVCGTEDNYFTGYNGAHTEGVIPLTCYTLTLAHTGSGGDPTASPANSSSCLSGRYHAGETISLTSYPDPGWAVGSWNGTSDDASTSTTDTLTMPASDWIVSANYFQPCYTLIHTHTGSGSDPTVLPINSTGCSSGQYHAGEAISLTANPEAGWAVGSWNGTNDDASTSTANSLIMPTSDMTITANYIHVCYTLTRAHTGSGGAPTALPVNSNGCSSGKYYAGEAISLTADPAINWIVGSWSGTVNDASTSTTNSLTMPASDRTVTANYINLFKIFLPLAIR